MVGISYRVVVADIPEVFPGDQSIEEGVVTLAREKATFVGNRYPESWILSADTVVVLGETVLQKPAGPEEARLMLERLSGRSHEVFTGYCLQNKVMKRMRTGVVRTVVVMKSLRPEEIERYIQTGEPMDKAGAYGIQGIGAMFVSRIYGSYTNVVGLPLSEVVELMVQEGIAFPMGG